MSKISIVVPVYYNEDTLMDLYQDMQSKILGQLGEYELVLWMMAPVTDPGKS